MKHDWIQTLSGIRFTLRPRPADIHIRDIAHGLATHNRFGGQAPIPYSVAQHSVLVSRHCVARKWGLMHDAAEAYLGDMPSPFKREMPAYKVAEARIMRAVARRFGLPPTEPEEIHQVDLRMRATERRDLITLQLDWASLDKTQNVEPFRSIVRPWGWRRAEREFLRRFDELFYGPLFFGDSR